MAQIERVIYRGGMVKHLRESKMLPAISIAAADLPEDVLALLDRRLFDLAGTYGDPEAATRSSTTSYTSSTTRATWRSSSTTAPSCSSRPTARR